MRPGYLRYTSIHHKIKHLQKKWNTDTNLIFLDFDGVFIIPRKDKKEYLERISLLCRTYQLKAVITSTWRFNMDRCEELLKPYDIDIHGRTEMEGNDRNLQIMNYLKTHPFHHILILDDMFLVKFQDYAVHTDFYTGFDEFSYLKAVQILERQAKEDNK